MAKDNEPNSPRRTDNSQSTSASSRSEQSIGELFSQMSDQIISLVNAEIALVKLNLMAKVKAIARSVICFVIGAVLALYGLGFLLSALAAGLNEGLGLARWLSLLIVAIVVLLICLILMLVGIRHMKKSKRYTPAPKEGLQKDIEAFKKGLDK